MAHPKLGRILTIIAVLALGSSGAFMLISPDGWYASVPGVPMTGPFNWHFVIDIGLAYLISAAGLLIAALRLNRALAVQAASWPVAHALFHLFLWAHHGVPQGLALPTEAVGVLGLGALAALGAWLLPTSKEIMT